MNIDAPIRNVDLDLTGSVAELHPEAIETIMDRGSLADWRLLSAEIEREPWGRVARVVENVAGWAEHYGVDPLMQRVIARARSRLDIEARQHYAERIRAWRRDAGLTLREMAVLAGTSESRLSAYENARVAPTTTVLGRIEEVARRHRATRSTEQLPS